MSHCVSNSLPDIHPRGCISPLQASCKLPLRRGAHLYVSPAEKRAASGGAPRSEEVG